MNRAQDAAKAWGGTVQRLLSHRENAVYEMRLPDGSKAALRQHRPGYQGVDSINDELVWTAALADQGFPCPRPLQTQDGALLISQDDHAFSAVSWVDATPVAGQGLDPDAWVKTFHALGGLLAQMHRLTDAMPDVGASRPSWALDGLTGADPLWGRYWESPGAGDPRCAKLLAARDVARAWLSDQTGFEQGLIHADALGENVMGSPDDLWLIDFDDSGHGYRLFDLGVALTQHWDQEYLPDIAHSLLAGYGATDVPMEDLLRFMTLRCLASAGWLQGRIALDDPQRDRYINRAVSCAERYFRV